MKKAAVRAGLLMAFGALLGVRPWLMQAAANAEQGSSGQANPAMWVDPATGHRVVRLSREPGRGSYNFYFHQNSFTAKGDKFVYTHINAGPGQSLWSLDIPDSAAFGSGKSTHLADAQRLLAFPVVAPKSRVVYYLDDHTIYGVNLDSLRSRTVATLPADWDMSPSSVSGLSVNSDETVLAASDTIGATVAGSSATGGARQNMIDTISSRHLPTFLFTVDLHTGKIAVIYKGNDWFDHVQFSPTDPSLILFAHEGPWEKVDRMWLIHRDGSGLVNLHPRTAAGEACGHEFWAADGQTVWCAFRAPDRSWSLLGQKVGTDQKIRYRLSAEQMSRHFNHSYDGKFFVGDGDTGNPTIQMLVPQPDGTLRYQPLCAADDDFNKREPNVMVSPDNKWVVFSSTKSGQSEVYAVSVER